MLGILGREQYRTISWVGNTLITKMRSFFYTTALSFMGHPERSRKEDV
jgi:hypothetical protein